jgi:hypothetical protein
LWSSLGVTVIFVTIAIFFLVLLLLFVLFLVGLLLKEIIGCRGMASGTPYR